MVENSAFLKDFNLQQPAAASSSLRQQQVNSSPHGIQQPAQTTQRTTACTACSLHSLQFPGACTGLQQHKLHSLQQLVAPCNLHNLQQIAAAYILQSLQKQQQPAETADCCILTLSILQQPPAVSCSSSSLHRI